MGDEPFGSRMDQCLEKRLVSVDVLVDTKNPGSVPGFLFVVPFYFLARIRAIDVSLKFFNRMMSMTNTARLARIFK